MKPFLWPLILLVVVSGCKEPFTPEIPDSQANVLVVEGYINVGTDAVTTISLSRTTSVTQSTLVDQETGAEVSIQSEFDDEYPLSETKPGQYVSPALDLPLNRRYRISIRTSDGKNYTSEFSTPIQTPPMDSVTWDWSPEGIGIYVTTHDDDANTKYYQWDYEEAWSVPSPFQTFYIWDNGIIKNRPVEDRIKMRRCWKYDRLTELMTETTAALTSDAIIKKRLKSLPIGVEQLGEKYSILIKQHALSKRAFEYLEIIQKNSTNVGSFTDPQPSQLFGNITLAGSDEQVVGLIESYTTDQFRLFISVNEVPYWNFSLHCEETLVPNDFKLQQAVFDGELWLVTKASVNPVLVFGTPAVCADCRLRGGSTIQPDYWQ